MAETAPAASGQRTVPSPSTLRLRLTAEQEAALEAFFVSSTKNINPVEMEILAAEMGISEADVQEWFSHRLSAWRREQGLSTNLDGVI